MHEKGGVGLLGVHGSHTFEYALATFCKVRHGDSVTKPDYYYYYWNIRYIIPRIDSRLSRVQNTSTSLKPYFHRIEFDS